MQLKDNIFKLFWRLPSQEGCREFLFAILVCQPAEVLCNIREIKRDKTNPSLVHVHDSTSFFASKVELKEFKSTKLISFDMHIYMEAFQGRDRAHTFDQIHNDQDV